MTHPDADHPDTPAPPQSSGASPSAPTSPFLEYYRPPRLGIIHLLAWTAATAALLKYWMAMRMLQNPHPATPQAINLSEQVHECIYRMIQGAGIVGTSVLLLAKARRIPGRIQPGHWLTFTETATLLMFCFGYALLLLAMPAGAAGYSPKAWAFWYLVVDGLVAILRAGMYLYATFASRDGRRWKALFGVLATVNLIRAISYAVGWFFWLWSLDLVLLMSTIVGIVLLATVGLDLRSRSRRDWLHWVGVAIIACGALLSIAS